jgi:hypothetical protein
VRSPSEALAKSRAAHWWAPLIGDFRRLPTPPPSFERGEGRAAVLVNGRGVAPFSCVYPLSRRLIDGYAYMHMAARNCSLSFACQRELGVGYWRGKTATPAACIFAALHVSDDVCE